MTHLSTREINTKAFYEQVRQENRVKTFYALKVNQMQPNLEVVVSFNSANDIPYDSGFCWSWKHLPDATRLVQAYLNRISQKVGNGERVEAFAIFEDKSAFKERRHLHCHIMMKIDYSQKRYITKISKRFWDNVGNRHCGSPIPVYVDVIDKIEAYTRYAMKNIDNDYPLDRIILITRDRSNIQLK